MKATGISKLKASLSEFLSVVKSGEEVLVTERGRAIARIVPIGQEARMPERLLAMEKQGRFRPGSGKIPETFWRTRKPVVAVGRVLEALRAEREDGP